jgi:4-cresol dehydrogenase (hydroxylating)
MDLSSMNRIREFDEQANAVILEPGVTQGQLCEFIAQAAPHMLPNVTGSSVDTSVLGNLLDRGVGYLAPRSDDLIALEVVLGDGRMMRTAGWHSDSLMKYRTSHGVGPSLNGLFTQSNLGVVTAAVVRIRNRPPVQYGLTATIADDASLHDFMDALQRVHSLGLINVVTHVFDTSRMQTSAGTRLGAWSAFSAFGGTERGAEAARLDIEEALSDVSEVRFQRLVPSDDESPHDVPREILACFGGHPTNLALESLVALHGEAYAADEVDRSRTGTIFTVQMIPCDGDAARRCTDVMRQVSEPLGFRPSISLNLISETALEVVGNIVFDRADVGAMQRAHDCLRAMESALRHEGFAPYRLGIHNMREHIDPTDTFWQTVHDLKNAVDPSLIIAPGRYNYT